MKNKREVGIQRYLRLRERYTDQRLSGNQNNHGENKIKP